MSDPFSIFKQISVKKKKDTLAKLFLKKFRYAINIPFIYLFIILRV